MSAIEWLSAEDIDPAERPIRLSALSLFQSASEWRPGTFITINTQACIIWVSRSLNDILKSGFDRNLYKEKEKEGGKKGTLT